MDSTVIALPADAARRSRFDGVSILLHWSVVLLVAALFATGFATRYVTSDHGLGALLFVHRSLGVCVLGLSVVRLLWRQTFAYLPPFPPNMLKLQQWAAKANEFGLYAFLLLQPLTGLGDTIFRGRSFALLAWTIPALAPRIPGMYELLHASHEFGAKALVGLVGLHSAAALFHSIVLRDSVLRRMLPGEGR